MKVWNPNRKHFEAAPPMPEFVGQWRTATNVAAGNPPSLLRRFARAALVRANAVTVLILDAIDGVPRGSAFPGETIPNFGKIDPAPMPETERARALLPLSSGIRIKPKESARISARPQTAGFCPERLIIGGKPEHWVVNDIKIGRHSQLADDGDLPGEAFSAGSHADVRLDFVPTAGRLTMIVTYVGPDPDGEAFECVAVGVVANSMDDVQTRRIYLPIGSGVNILPNTSAQITTKPQDIFRPERIVLGGNPEAWIINDIKVGNRSQFSQAGDVPGDMFAATALDPFVSFETVQTAMDFTIIVTYIGDEEQGEPLLACAIGTIPALV